MIKISAWKEPFGPPLPSASGDDGTGGAGPEEHTEGAVIAEKKTEVKPPSLYRVILLNDDFTPMDFVVSVLEKFFTKSHLEATEIMLDVHNKGKGQCGVFPYEVAETKVAQVTEHARENEHPLQCVTEKA